MASAWLVCLAAVLLWVLRTSVPTLRWQLRFLQFWSLEICVILGVAVTAVVVGNLRRLVDRRDLPGIALPVAVALFLTVGLAPRTNRIYYDEHIYQSAGQNLANLKLAQICHDGTVENGRLRCSRWEYNKQPYAYPHLLSLVYRMFGVGTTAAFVVNAVAMCVTVGLVYLLVVILFSDRRAGFFAALLLALTPERVVWSASAAVEPTASMACMAALLSVACFVRTRSPASLFGAAVATAYAVQFRPESVLIVPVVALLVWQRAREEFARPRLWWACLVFLGLVSVHIGHMVAVRNEGWGTTQERFALAYLRDNLRVNGWFYLWDARFPAAYTLLAILGLSGRRIEAGRAAVACYFLLFFAIPLAFYAGSYDYGADVRYSLATYPPLTILAGLGVARFAGAIDRIKPGLPSMAGVTAAVALQFVWYSPIVRASSDGAWASRADVAFAASFVPYLPRNSYVLTHNPTMFQLWRVSAGQMSMVVANPAYLDDLIARYQGGVYLHWNYWCNVQDPVQRALCTKVLELRSGELVRESREQDQRYAFYRLDARQR